MENSLKMFDFEGRRGRFVLIDGEPWFVAKDVLLSLDYAEDYNPSRAIAAIPDEWKGVQPMRTLGGNISRIM
jgi:prophage antirepressor-like protein